MSVEKLRWEDVAAIESRRSTPPRDRPPPGCTCSGCSRRPCASAGIGPHTTTCPRRTAHLHCTRTSREPTSKARSYLWPSESGLRTPMPSFDRCEGDRGLGDRALLIGRQHHTNASSRAGRSDSARGGFQLDRGQVAPEVLEPVELARLRREHVQDDVEVVGDDPVALLRARPPHAASWRARP